MVEHRHLKYLLSATLVIIFSLQGCAQTPERVSVSDSIKPDMSIKGNFSQQSDLVFDSTQITLFFERFPAIIKYEQDVRGFYRNRDFSYAWFEKGLLIEQAGNLSARILNIGNDGIYKKLFYQAALDSLLHGVNEKGELSQPDISLELLLTSEYFAYSKLAWEGMNSGVSKANKWYLPRKAIDYNSYLDTLLNTPTDKTEGTEPVYRQYELLRGYLRKYREIDENENWSLIVSKIKVGDSSLLVSQIKKRLFKLGDFTGDTLNRSFNAQLSEALVSFQERHGLNPGGFINEETISQLNIPLKNRIKQIIVNMERSRWLPVKLEGNYVAVNIPEFKLHVYRADSLLWSSNAVVGQTTHPTTLFYGEIKYVVFSPYWNIPPGILRKEIIPGMRKSSSYLAKHRMEITGYRDGLPVVRQKPGPSNSLGLVKFLFPNSYNIYLHDTPSKSLFDESSRAFSHGCIRIEKPAKLAAFLLNDIDKWSSDNINKAMHAGTEQYVTLNKKVPVFITYFTAFIDRQGKLNFRKDIYNLDERLASMIIAGEGVNY